MGEWLVVEDISGDEPRLDAIKFNQRSASILIACANVRSIWRVTDDTKEEAISSVSERMRHGAHSPVVDILDGEVLEATKKEIIGRKNLVSREILLAVLDQCGGNRSKMARVLNLNRKTIWKYCQMYKIPLNAKSGATNTQSLLQCQN